MKITAVVQKDERSIQIEFLGRQISHGAAWADRRFRSDRLQAGFENDL